MLPVAPEVQALFILIFPRSLRLSLIIPVGRFACEEEESASPENKGSMRLDCPGLTSSASSSTGKAEILEAEFKSDLCLVSEVDLLSLCANFELDWLRSAGNFETLGLDSEELQLIL